MTAERIREVLPTVSIAAARYRKLSAERTGAPPPAEQQRGEVAIQWQVQPARNDDAVMAYIFRTSLERPDVTVEVVFEIHYRSEDATVWQEPGLAPEFGARVALMNAYPYLRVKVHELATMVEVSPPILDVLVAPLDTGDGRLETDKGAAPSSVDQD